MTIFEGSFKLESSDGLAAGFAAMGIMGDRDNRFKVVNIISTLRHS